MAFDEGTLRKTWEKGTIVANVDPDIWRKDACGAWIRWDFYGNVDSQFGWEIDLVVPGSEGGGVGLPSLRPLQWRNKTTRRGGRLVCPITASGKYNIPR